MPTTVNSAHAIERPLSNREPFAPAGHTTLSRRFAASGWMWRLRIAGYVADKAGFGMTESNPGRELLHRLSA